MYDDQERRRCCAICGEVKGLDTYSGSLGVRVLCDACVTGQMDEEVAGIPAWVRDESHFGGLEVRYV